MLYADEELGYVKIMPWTLREVAFLNDRLINLAEEISRQWRIQTGSWSMLTAFS
jgi:hypothetical protein